MNLFAASQKKPLNYLTCFKNVCFLSSVFKSLQMLYPWQQRGLISPFDNKGVTNTSIQSKGNRGQVWQNLWAGQGCYSFLQLHSFRSPWDEIKETNFITQWRSLSSGERRNRWNGLNWVTLGVTELNHTVTEVRRGRDWDWSDQRQKTSERKSKRGFCVLDGIK